jgi:hypothetical protein
MRAMTTGKEILKLVEAKGKMSIGGMMKQAFDAVAHMGLLGSDLNKMGNILKRRKTLEKHYDNQNWEDFDKELSVILKLMKPVVTDINTGFDDLQRLEGLSEQQCGVDEGEETAVWQEGVKRLRRVLKLELDDVFRSAKEGKDYATLRHVGALSRVLGSVVGNMDEKEAADKLEAVGNLLLNHAAKREK